MINDRATFAIALLKIYAIQNQTPARSTSDLSPLELWLIDRLFNEQKKQVQVT